MLALSSACPSFSGTMQVAQSIANELIPQELRSYIASAVRKLFTPQYHTLIIDEHYGMTCRNPVFEAAEIYLSDKFGRAAARLQVAKAPRQQALTVFIDNGQKFDDVLDDNIKLRWRFILVESNYGREKKRYFELSFHKKFKDRVLDSYLPSVLIQANDIKERQKVIKIYTRKCSYDDEYLGRGRHDWAYLNLEHPSTFETLAIDPKLKKTILEDLDTFVKRKEFYKKVGKAWKRGYLLYGPPGTGKTSLIAAMANYLKFDIYDLDLNSIRSNSDLTSVLLSTTNRSILVIEDIDCSVDQQNPLYYQHDNKMTLSGILNFIDGLWSSCGDERIIVFTTNHKDRLDPALLRPGRMDMHINLSYCTKHSFETLASNYLGVHDHQKLCVEIEGLISGGTHVSPAEVAEELMKSEDKAVALDGLVNLLKRKRVEMIETREKEIVEATVVHQRVVNFLKRKKAKSVRNKDKETTDTIVALEELVDLAKQKKIEADGVLRKDQEEVDQDEGPKSKRFKTTEKRNSVRKGRKS